MAQPCTLGHSVSQNRDGNSAVVCVCAFIGLAHWVLGPRTQIPYQHPATKYFVEITTTPQNTILVVNISCQNNGNESLSVKFVTRKAGKMRFICDCKNRQIDSSFLRGQALPPPSCVLQLIDILLTQIRAINGHLGA